MVMKTVVKVTFRNDNKLTSKHEEEKKKQPL